MADSTYTEPQQFICGNCNGSGEGMSERSRCRVCEGSGVQYFYPDSDEPVDNEPDWDYIRKARIEDEMCERASRVGVAA